MAPVVDMVRLLRLPLRKQLHSFSHGKNTVPTACRVSVFDYVNYFVIFTRMYVFQVMVLSTYSNRHFSSCSEKQNAAPDHSASYLPVSLFFAGETF